MEPKVTDAALAQLSRSWCLVCDALRELRGIPKAGQMRPDLDPVQAMKAMRRLRSRMPLEVAGSAVDITEDEQSETDTKESL
jgi:hypothetical protein